MKKIFIITMSAILMASMATAAFAKTARTSSSSSEAGPIELDGGFTFGTGPGDFGSAFGFNFGGGYMLEAVPNLQIRADLSYYDFSRTFFTDLSYTRIPFTVGARYYFPMNDRLKLFAQAGLETSFDKIETTVPVFIGGQLVGLTQSSSEVNIGISPGGGIEFFITPQVSIFALGRIHIIADDYFSMNFGAAAHF